jgi:hypothetical protein
MTIWTFCNAWEVKKVLFLTSTILLKSIRKKCVYIWLSHQINAVWGSVQICRPVRIVRYPTMVSLHRMLIQTCNSYLYCSPYHEPNKSTESIVAVDVWNIVSLCNTCCLGITNCSLSIRSQNFLFIDICQWPWIKLRQSNEAFLELFVSGKQIERSPQARSLLDIFEKEELHRYLKYGLTSRRFRKIFYHCGENTWTRFQRCPLRHDVFIQYRPQLHWLKGLSAVRDKFWQSDERIVCHRKLKIFGLCSPCSWIVKFCKLTLSEVHRSA